MVNGNKGGQFLNYASKKNHFSIGHLCHIFYGV